MTAATKPRQSLRFRGRSFLALVLAPEEPLDRWLSELDDWSRRSPGFFAGRPVVLDVSALKLDKAGLADLISGLQGRDIRLMGVEGTKGSWLGPGMPPLISGGRQVETAGAAEAAEAADAVQAVEADNADGADGAPAETPPPAIKVPHQGPNALVIDSPVRSGQSVVFPQGDVTIIGHVASGAEVIAGGSIHVYGALRGRAIAGSNGNPRARIFCRKLEAEFVAIDGLYRTADETESDVRGRAAQIWLDGDAIIIAALN
jgi:septum site-determining protein MinC